MAGLVYSSAQFYFTRADAERQLTIPRPGGETLCFVDLASGVCQLSGPLSFEVPVLWIMPWVDRWGPERGRECDDLACALQLFDQDCEQLCGATGILSSVLLDLEARRIARFALVVPPPLGVVYQPSFPT